MDINLYLQRINYTGSLAPTLATLAALHRHHLLTVPYENFDIHLGRRIELSEAAFFDKLIVQKRGGWCFEMNGLFAAVLRELGFEVQLLAGSVRSVAQHPAQGDHLVLLVELERPYLVDVGFGDGFLEPLPLEEGEYAQGGLTFQLSRETQYWVLHNHPAGAAKRYDFTLEPQTLEGFKAMNHELQTSPSSGFVRTTVCQRITKDAILTLRGATFSRINRAGVTERVIESEADYRQTLVQDFGLDLGDISALWPRVWASHQEWLKRSENKS